MPREHLVVIEGLDEQDVVIREPVPVSPPLLAEWRGTGASRGGWEALEGVEVVYVPPRSRRAA